MTTISDVAAEEALLGAVLWNADAAGPALRSVPPDAWWRPINQTLATVLTGMLVRGEPIDPTTVLSQVMADGLLTQVDGAYLARLYTGFTVVNHAPTYAARITELGAQRNLVMTMQRNIAMLDGEFVEDDRIDTHSAVSRLRTACDEAERSAQATTYEPTSLDELLAGEDQYRWLVPGLLERGDRMVLTGAEGSGKSVLVSQVAATLCGGLHPFTGTMLGDGSQQIRVLVVDTENSEAQTRRRYRRLVRSVDGLRFHADMPPVDWAHQFFVEIRPQGLDLTRGADVAWLERAMQATAPDLLVIGPLYRLHHGDPNDERLARELVHVLDSVRVRHNCALITEAHAGHATDSAGDRRMRPSGSSLWLRWPEYGYGLRRAKDQGDLGTGELARRNRERPVLVDVVAWRGSREERNWPTSLQHGQTLPWTPADPDYYLYADRMKEF
ncbi:AAA family ATPase [Saccharopolyspora spinosa]|uniref:Replicative DNA helicase n=1 Tax=Saccharopolyspora spinosa TaxID=60894 RepID=A0A2N3XZA7_SACSN|nr:AAA family ATPase [Saccharopolyspora spinosa]PKW15950.1 replicative DNA helicase [Saccharopolyspora spinosa]